MAQSINTTVEYTGSGISYLGIGGKVGKFLLGNNGFEFYSDSNVENFIQIPWTEVSQIGANVSRKKISRHFQIFTEQGKFLFASKDSGKILKLARQHIGNEKVIKLPTLMQTIGNRIKGLFKKK